MKETILDVLRYLFDHYVEDGGSEYMFDRESLQAELREAGFDDGQVNKAFEWLRGLVPQQGGASTVMRPQTEAMRVYTNEEKEKLGRDGCGFIYLLEQVGVLDGYTRELAVDRVMALGSDEIDLAQLKWIVLMVLFNQPGSEENLIWMEHLFDDDVEGCMLH